MSQRRSTPKKKSPIDTRPILEELEPRQLFSGGLEGVLLDDPLAEPPIYLDITNESSPGSALVAEFQASESAAVTERQELVFIDTDVEDYQELFNDILAQDDSERNIEVILLDNQRDGIEQISEVLAGYQNLDAVHLISHGSDGSVDVGNTQLDFESLSENSTAIKAWGESFSEEGDFLIYGCNLAASEVGQSLIDALSNLTETDVAASDDLTGQAGLGGDWDLEYKTGSVETSLALDTNAQAEFQGVLNAYVVNTAADSGAGSLRQAIIDANANANSGGPDTITFDIGADGSQQTITLLSVLDPISEAVTIDGFSQYGALTPTTPLIELNGTNVSDDGLTLASGSDGSTIQGLIINNFDGSGIQIESDNNIIAGNYVGTNATGTTGLGNGAYGINVLNAAGNTIGGIADIDRNVISGNADVGIMLIGAGTTGTSVQGNYIGTNAAGTSSIANTNDGVTIRSNASNNTIGGTTAAERNIISGNGEDGVFIGFDAYSNTVSGNYIGTDVTGTAALANARYGVTLYNGVNNNTIGGTAAGAGNVISANVSSGVVIDGAGGSTTDNNLILGNYIGTDKNGTADLGNGGKGIHFFNGADTNTIGGVAAGAGNVISGNAGAGIYFEDAGTDNNVIQGNFIGTDNTGTVALGNSSNNININSGAGNNTVGGSAAGAGNIIADSGNDGITIWGGTTTGNIVQGNYIGTDTSGTINLGNSAVGVVVSGGSNNNIIGGTGAGEGNTIAYNNDTGVSIRDFGSLGNSILANSIYSNVNIGIDLGTAGVTANDAGDGDSNIANNLQNFPVLSAATTDGAGSITINGTFNSSASTTFRLEFFSNSVDDGNGEGETYLGFVNVTTDGSGNATFNTPISATVTVGSYISATATNLTTNDTSEFALNVQATTGVSVSGASTIVDGSVYTLNLNAGSTMDGWTINWGDGTIDNIVGDPATTTHTYSGTGFTYNITASATDAGGTYFQGDVLIGGYDSDSAFIHDGSSGLLLQEFATSDGLNQAIDTVIGPDGNIYVSGYISDQVLRYAPDGTFIDEFIPAADLNLEAPTGIAFGPDGNLYVSSQNTNEVLRYDASTGAFIDVFATGGLSSPEGLIFGPDGNLYVSNFTGNNIVRFDGTTGASLGVFATGGLNSPEQMAFGSGGDLYVVSYNSGEILRFDGTTGSQIGGAFITVAGPTGIAFGPDGNVYVSSYDNDNIQRYDSAGTFIDVYVADVGGAGADGSMYIEFIPGQQVTVTASAVTFQQGVDGYAGTQDTYTDENFSTTNNGSLTEVAVDLDDGAGDATTQGLIRFDDIFGVGAGQVPVGATINSAELTVYVTNVSNGAAQVTLHSMLMDWNEASTWDSTVNGVATDNIEASSTIDSTLASPDSLGSQTFTGLAAVLQAWSDGAANYGWVITTDNENGWDFASSENGTVSFRPVLTIDYTIAANNNAPVNTVPGSQITNEDTAIIFNAANSNLISISDDAGEVLTTTISVNNGVLTLSQMTGLTFDAGADGTATMTVTGTVENINAALDGMQYDPVPDYNGGDTLTITANDAELLALNLDSNLQGYYALDSADPTGDSGPNSAPAGVLNGDAFIATGTARGDVLSLDGTNDYVQIGDDFGIDSGTFTLALWVNLDASATPATVINVGARAEIRLDETVLGLGVFAAYNDGGAPWKQTTTGTFLAGTGWHHVAYTVDGAGNEQVVYIDGVAITTTNHTASILSGSSGITNIGVNGGISYDFAGQIDDTRIYGRALSASDIATLASAPLNVSDTDTVAIAISAVNDAPVAIAGGPYNILEGGGVTLDASSSSDPDSDPLTYSWDLNNDLTYGDATGVSPTLTWAQLQSFGINDDGTYTINVEVDDGNGGITTDSTTIIVANVAHTISATGDTTVAAGSTYTLNLSESDAGDDTISEWHIDWGDGTIETIVGNPSSVTHVYQNEGLPHNIVVSATDEDGTYTNSKVISTARTSGDIFILDGITGNQIAQVDNATSNGASGVVIGPDGFLYATSDGSNEVFKYNATTGALIGTFITAGSGGLNTPHDITFGPDGNAYVASFGTDEVLRYDGTTGAFIDVFVTAGSGGLDAPTAIAFGPDGNFYVGGFNSQTIVQYDGTTGAFIQVVANAGAGANNFTFGPDGRLYHGVSNSGRIDVYETAGWTLVDTINTASSNNGMTFGPDGYLYVGESSLSQITIYDVTTGLSVGIFADSSDGLSGVRELLYTPEHQVTVTAASNSISIANNDSYNTNEDTPLIIDPTANDTDADGDSISVIEFTQPTNGSVVDNGDGTLTYTPDAEYSGADSFEYVAIDSGAGLQNYWGLDGDAVDAIGGADGTLNGTTTVAGDVGSALSFNETTDYALLPDVTYASEFSITFDFKIDDNTGSLFQYIYSHGDINSTNSINIFLNEATHGTDPNMLRTVVRDADDTLDNTALETNIASLIGDSQWHTYTLTAGVNGLEVYIDGVSVATDATRGTDAIDPATGLYLGARQDLDANRRYGGALDSIQIYDNALSAAQVSDLSSDNNRAKVNITVDAVNDAPTITSNGGGVTAAINVTENTTVVTTVTATDADLDTPTFSIDPASDDAAFFSIDPNSGALIFNTVPDFETAADLNGDNIYEVTVKADDGNGGVDTQAISVTVTDQAITTVSATGASTVLQGGLYTLNLSADEDTTSWTINWGDGTIQTVAGNPSSVTHTYSDGYEGLTFNILASAADGSGDHFINDLIATTTFLTGEGLYRYSSDGSYTQTFSGGELTNPYAVIVGPDGYLYVAGHTSDNVVRYDAVTGAFVDEFISAGSGGLNAAAGLAFGPDGNLYVSNQIGDSILKYDGSTGAFLGTFVTGGSGGLNGPASISFRSDGYLYVSSYNTNSVLRYDATTGAYADTFVTAASGGLNGPGAMAWGPDGNLYIGGTNSVIKRFDGSTGVFIDNFVTAGSGGLGESIGLTFGPDGNLYVSSFTSDQIIKYDGTTGALIGDYVVAGSGGLDGPAAFTFIPNQQVTIVNVNDAPSGADKTVTATEDTDYVFTVADFGFSDVESPANNFLNVIIATAPANGILYLDANGDGIVDGGETLIASSVVSVADITAGKLKFQPVANANSAGYDSFTFQVQDDGGVANGGVDTDQSANTITIDVTAVNDVPMATGNTVIANEDVPLVIGASDFNFTDVESDSLASVTITGLNLNGGTLTHSAGAVTVTNGMTVTVAQLADLTFTSALNDSTNSSLTYTVNDAGTGVTSAVMNITVNAVNDVPVATGNTVIANEDVPLVIGTGDFNFTDIEADSLASVTITGLNLNGGTLTHSAGAVTVTNGMTVTAAQLADLTFTSASNDSTDASFTYTVNDAGTGVTSSIMNITVNAVNDVPVATGNTVVAQEDVPLVINAAAFNFTDVEADSLASVTITGLNLNGGTLTHSAGAVTVTNGMTVTAAQLADLTFTSALNDSTDSSFTYTVNDAGTGVTSAVINITVNAVNDVPVATGNTVIANEDVPLVIGSGDFNFTDVEADSLASVAITGLNLNGGTLTHSAGAVTVTNGMIVTAAQLSDLTFTSASNDSTDSSFTYTVNDAGTGVTSAVMNITVNAINDVPVATGNTVIASEDVSLVIGAGDFNFTDVESDSLVSVTITGLTLNGGTLTHSAGAVTVTNGMIITAAQLADLTFASALNDSTDSSFTYTVNDAGTGVTSAVMNITVNAVNDVPVATGNTVIANEDVPLVIGSGDFNFTDVEADSLASVTITGLNLNGGTLTHTGGAVTVTNGMTITAAQLADLTFTSAINDSTDSSFTYTVNDAGTGVTSAVMNITLNAVNDVPVATGNTVIADEDVSLVIGLGDFNFTDVEGDSLASVTITGLNLNSGTLTHTGGTVNVTNGMTITAAQLADLTFTSALNDSTNSSFTYTVNDAGTGITSAVMNITVNAVNDVPVATGNTVIANEDVPLVIGASDFNFTDTEGDSLASVTITGLNLNGGTLTHSAGAVTVTNGMTITAAQLADLTFTSASNDSTDSSFTYTVNDAGTGVTSAVMNITVNGVNDVPVATGNTVIANEDVPLVIGAGDFNFTDVEGDSLASITITGLNLNGGTLTHTGGTVNVTNAMTITAAQLADLTFTSASNDSTDSSFTYTVNDAGTGVTSAVMNITVNAINDVPVATGNTVIANEDVPLVIGASDFNFTDVESDVLASVTITGLNLNGGALTHSAGAVTVTNGMIITAAQLADLTFTSASNDSTDSSFTYTVNDAGTGVTSAVMNITVNAVNDVPVATGNTVIASEDVPLVIGAGDFNFTDVESDSLASVTITGLTLNGGTLTHSAGAVTVTNGMIITAAQLADLTFTSASNDSTDSSLTYTVNDAGTGVTSAVMNITVNAVNDVPVATGNTVIANEDVPLVIGAGDFNFTDTESDVLNSVTITGLTLNGGTLTHSAGAVTVTNGMTITAAQLADLTFTSALNDSTNSSFIYTVNDAGTGVTSAVMNITVNAVNDVPVATGNTVIAAEDVPLVIGAGNFNFTDTEGDSLASVTLTGLTLNGGTLTHTGGSVNVNNGMTITAAQLADLTFTSALNDSTDSSFTYTVNDAGTGITSSIMNITVNAINDVPVATGNTVIANEDVPLVIGASDFNFTDVESDVLASVTITGLNLNGGALTHSAGAVTVTNGMIITAAQLADLTFASALNDSTDSSFTYTVNDAGTGVTSAVMNITVNAVNDVPVATGNTVIASEDVPLVIGAGDFNFTDVESDSLASVTITGLTLNGGTLTHSAGAVTVTNGMIITAAQLADLTFTSASNDSTDSSFTYTVNDAGTGVTSAVMNITVNAITMCRSLPAIRIASEDVPLVIGAGDFNFTDVEGDSLASVTITGLNLNGGTLTHSAGAVTVTNGMTVTVAQLADLTFTSGVNDSASSSFTYTVNDTGAGVTSAIMNITVNAVNDVPVATGNTVIANEDVPLVISSSDFNFTDVEGDSLASVTISGLNLNGGTLTHSAGAVTVTNGMTVTAAQLVDLTFTSASNDSTDSSFTYTVNDAEAGVTSAVMNITVNAVNDVPVATGNTVIANEDVPLVIGAGDFNFTDVESDSLASVTITGLNLNGGTLTHTGGIVNVTNG